MSNLPSKFDSNSSLSRRDLLLGASAGAAVSLAAPALAWSQAASSAGNPAKGHAASALTAASMPQGWTLDEIHRRWLSIRTLMKAAQLDCLLLPGAEPDGRYVSASSASWVVFPLDGRPAAIFPGREPLPVEILGAGAGSRERSSEKSGDKSGEKAGEKSGSDLGMDLRSPRTEAEGMVSPLLADVLREKGMTQARIGVSNLQDVYRNLEGNVNYTTYDHVLKAFPQAKFVPASDLMMRVKLVRSPEEISRVGKGHPGRRGRACGRCLPPRVRESPIARFGRTSGAPCGRLQESIRACPSRRTRRAQPLMAARG